MVNKTILHCRKVVLRHFADTVDKFKNSNRLRQISSEWCAAKFTTMFDGIIQQQITEFLRRCV